MPPALATVARLTTACGTDDLALVVQDSIPAFGLMRDADDVPRQGPIAFRVAFNCDAGPSPSPGFQTSGFVAQEMGVAGVPVVVPPAGPGRRSSASETLSRRSPSTTSTRGEARHWHIGDLRRENRARQCLRFAGPFWLTTARDCSGRTIMLNPSLLFDDAGDEDGSLWQRDRHETRREGREDGDP